MDSMVRIFLDRANNEIFAAESLKKLSEGERQKIEFNLPENVTFYSSVISHSYYSIFYAAKALLLLKNIRTSSPEIHRKTLEEFDKNFVKTGILDVKLLQIYQKMIIRADDLLEIFAKEKGNRGRFTYNTIPQANKEPAEDSLKNAKIFLANITKVIEHK